VLQGHKVKKNSSLDEHSEILVSCKLYSPILLR